MVFLNIVRSFGCGFRDTLYIVVRYFKVLKIFGKNIKEKLLVGKNVKRKLKVKCKIKKKRVLMF